MTKPLFLIFSAALLLGAAPARAADAVAPQDIIKKARCVACHTVDTKRVGPSYREVAARYQGQAGAAETLFKKVREGGTGVWGSVPMTPNGADKISDADLQAVVAWILAGAQ